MSTAVVLAAVEGIEDRISPAEHGGHIKLTRSRATTGVSSGHLAITRTRLLLT